MKESERLRAEAWEAENDAQFWNKYFAIARSERYEDFEENALPKLILSTEISSWEKMPAGFFKFRLKNGKSADYYPKADKLCLSGKWLRNGLKNLKEILL